MAEPEQQSHPEGHEVFHLPPPSIWPPVLAVAIALILTGLILNLIITIAGGVIAITAIALWVRDARHELAELPE